MIVYGQNPRASHEVITEYLAPYSPTNLKYKRKITYHGSKLDHVISVSDVHYAIDVPSINIEGLSAWFAALDLVRNSIVAQGRTSGLIVLYGLDQATNNLIAAVEQQIGQQLTTEVRLYCWIETRSLTCLPYSMLQFCNIVTASTSYQAKPTWRDSTIDNIADLIISEVQKGNKASIVLIRQHLYNVITSTLTIHDLVWPLLGKFVDCLSETAILPLEMLEEITIKCICSCSTASSGYRPILHLETLVVDLALAYDEIGRGMQDIKLNGDGPQREDNNKIVQDEVPSSAS